MAYATKYKIEFDAEGNVPVKIEIQEDAFSGSITHLQSSYINLEWKSDDSKLPGIKQSTLKFDILIQSTLTPEDFINASDTKFKVLVYYNSTLQWSGWIVSKNSYFEWKDTSYLMQIEAKDGLHLLSTRKLLDLSDQPLWISYRAKDFITWCLDKTDLGLNFWTWINIYPDGETARTIGNPENDPFYYTFIDSRTFEYDYSLAVLQKIVVGFGCSLFQARGKWHIVFIEDLIRDIGLYGTEWNSLGTAQGIASAQEFILDIGLYKSHKFINGVQSSYQEAHKEVKVNYAFEKPNRIRNIDLTESVFDTYINSGTIGRYALTYWTYTGTIPYVITELDINNEETTESNKRIQIIDDATNSYSEFSSTVGIVQEGDHFEFSFAYGLGDPINNYVSRLRVDIKLTSAPPVADKYLGIDGKWKTTRQFITVPNLDGSGAYYTIANGGNFSLETVQPLPTLASAIQIIFKVEDPLGGEGVAPTGSFLHAIWDMQFNYIPLAAMPNKIAEGHYFKITQDSKKEIFEDQTYISDSRNITFKGAIFNGSSDIERYWFHNGITEELRFIRLIANVYFKLLHRDFLFLEGELLNMANAGYIISPLDTATVDGVTDAKFLFSDITVDLRNNKSDITLIEYTDGTDFSASGTESFKLIDAKDKDILVRYGNLPKRIPRSNKRFVRFIDSIMTSIFGGGPTP